MTVPFEPGGRSTPPPPPPARDQTKDIPSEFGVNQSPHFVQNHQYTTYDDVTMSGPLSNPGT